MIPKIIHYCWFGGNDIPPRDVKCIESWKKYCPEYKIIQWNESNYNVEKCEYMYQAYKAKKWSFVSDYARLDIVFEYGGFYLDTDVELLTSLDILLNNQVFMGFESDKYVATGLGFGAEPHNKLIKEHRNTYHSLTFVNSDGTFNYTAAPTITTGFLLSKGLKLNGKQQQIESMTIYPAPYFNPLNYYTGRLKILKETISIHWYNASWLDESQRKRHLLEAKINRMLGLKVGYFVNCGINAFFYFKKNGAIAFINKIKDKIR